MARPASKKEKVVHIDRSSGDRGIGERPSTPPPSRFRSFEEMEHMFEEFMPHRLMHPSSWEFPTMGDWFPAFEHRLSPRVDIIDRETELLLRAQIPGVEKKDLHVSMTENMVTIEGMAHTETTEEKGNYYRRECSSGSFTRTVALPCGVDSSKASASYTDGVLEMTLPKLGQSARRPVPIH